MTDDDETRTSVTLPDEMHSYVKTHDSLTFTELMQDAIASRMGSDDEAERIRRELEEKREEREELEDKLDQLDAQINVLADRLENLEESKEAPYDDLVDKLSELKKNMEYYDELHELHEKRLNHITDEVDIDVTTDDLRACLDYAVEWDTEEGALTERKVAPDEEFTDGEEERARNFLKD